MTENRDVKPALRSESPCILAAMRAATRRLTQLYDEAMAPSGLRVTQYHILSELQRREAESPTMSEMAEILTIERSALGQTLRPLERDGFITLGRDPEDARRRPVRLTRAGRQALSRARQYWAEAHRRAEQFLGETAFAALRATLRDLAEDPELSDAFYAAGAANEK
jgi:DNA-binding MarR family transcriptional regulator